MIIASAKYYFSFISFPNPYSVIDISDIQLRKYYYSLESIQRFSYKRKWVSIFFNNFIKSAIIHVYPEISILFRYK